jgi:hypothetical protein
MNERILELANEANKDIGYTFKLEDANQLHELIEKFAELIVRECATALFDESERLSGLYSEEDNWNSAEEYEIRSNQCIDDITLIEKHFGVEE